MQDEAVTCTPSTVICTLVHAKRVPLVCTGQSVESWQARKQVPLEPQKPVRHMAAVSGVQAAPGNPAPTDLAHAQPTCIDAPSVTNGSHENVSSVPEKHWFSCGPPSNAQSCPATVVPSIGGGWQ